MSKPNWVCSACGMWSGRKYTVKRHIANLHNGTPPVVSYIDYLVGARSGRYRPRSPTIYRTKTMSEISSSNTLFLEEVVRAAARELVQKAFNPPPMKNQPRSNIVGQQRTYSFWDDIENIFALGAYVCNKCLAIEPFKICLVEGNKKGSRIESLGSCNPGLLNNAKGINNINEHIRGLHHQIPVFLQQLVNAWSENKGESYLIAFQIPDAANKRSIELTFKAGSGVNKTIAVPYSEDKCRHLVLLPRTITEQDQHWANRVVSHAQTPLSDDELLDFLVNLNNNTTFGFFKIISKDELCNQVYLVAITKSSQSCLSLTS
jgi:hypothetical protein